MISQYLKSEGLAVMIMKITIARVIMPCSFVASEEFYASILKAGGGK
jgi:hypothetical protein